MVLVVARSGIKRTALSLAAVKPTVAEVREAEVKGVAPSFSMLLKMTAEESPDPDFKDMYLLARAAPASETVSEDDPAPGKVSAMVDVEDAFSETTVSPLDKVVTDAVLVAVDAGDVEGILFYFDNVNREKEKMRYQRRK